LTALLADSLYFVVCLSSSSRKARMMCGTSHEAVAFLRRGNVWLVTLRIHPVVALEAGQDGVAPQQDIAPRADRLGDELAVIVGDHLA
jgi:hypothetical protein